MRFGILQLSTDTTMKNENAVNLGRLGGKSKSEAKAAAARENGKLGGRPRNEVAFVYTANGQWCHCDSSLAVTGRGMATQIEAFRSARACGMSPTRRKAFDR